MSELLKLAERCEQAAGADRELDAEIGVAMGVQGEPWGCIRPFGPAPAGSIRDPNNRRGALAYAQFTSSLDAAMTLTDWEFTLFRGDDYSHVNIGDPMLRINATAATPALALTAAALYARARDNGSRAERRDDFGSGRRPAKWPNEDSASPNP